MADRPWREMLLPLIVLLAAAFLLYSGTFSHGWTYDDNLVIVTNPDVRSISNFIEDHYPGRPLRELTYLLDYSLFGLRPAGYHVQNILWHGLNAFLIFVLVARLGGGRVAAWGASLLFLVHPVNVEVVANVSHRKDSLALAFILISLLAYAASFDAARRRWAWLAAALAAGWAAWLAKENAVVLPFLFLAYEHAFVSQERRLIARSRVLLRIGAGAALAVVVAWYVRLLSDGRFREAVRNAMAKMEEYSDWTLSAYFRTVLKSWSFLLSKLAWPFGLSPEYTFPAPSSWFDPWIAATLLIVCAALFLLRKTYRREPLSFFAIFFVILLWLPTSNIFGHYAYFAADRYLYAPAAGLCVLAALPFERLHRVKPALALCALMAILASLSTLTWRQSRIWRSNFDLYTHVLQVNPKSLVGLTGLGTHYMEHGEGERALDLFLRALPRSPNDPVLLNNIGFVRYRKGETVEALAFFQRAVAQKPDYAEAYNNMGSVYDDLGQAEKARAAFERAISLSPHYERAYANLGILCERAGRLDEAERMQRRAIAELPGYGEAHFNLGVVLFKRERFPEALQEFQTATALMPESADALLNLGITRVRVGDRQGAAALLPSLRLLDPTMAGRLEDELREKAR